MYFLLQPELYGSASHLVYRTKHRLKDSLSARSRYFWRPRGRKAYLIGLPSQDKEFELNFIETSIQDHTSDKISGGGGGGSGPRSLSGSAHVRLTADKITLGCLSICEVVLVQIYMYHTRAVVDQEDPLPGGRNEIGERGGGVRGLPEIFFFEKKRMQMVHS